MIYKTCENCGAPLAKGVRFCTGCGTPVPQEEVQQTDFSPEPSKPEAAYPTYEAPAWQTHEAPATIFTPQEEGGCEGPRQETSEEPAKAQKTYRGRPWPEKGDPFRPVGAWQFFGILLLLSIPIVNIILVIIWALGGCKKVNLRNFARGILLCVALGLVLVLILSMLAAIYQDEIVRFIIEEMQDELGDMPYLPTWGYDYGHGNGYDYGYGYNSGGFEHGWQS